MGLRLRNLMYLAHKQDALDEKTIDRWRDERVGWDWARVHVRAKVSLGCG